MFQGFQEVLSLSHLRNFGPIFSGLESFMKKDYNILVRAYLVNNLFIDNNFYFGKIRNIDLIKNDWRGFGYNETKTRKHLLVHDLEDDFNHFIERIE